MAVNATAASQTPRELPPAGTHVARCVGLVQIGTVTETFQDGKVKTLPKLRLTWELPMALKDFGNGKGLQPFLVAASYTVSLSEKANLRRILQSWRGREFTPEELKGFNVENVVGVPCLLTVIHKTSTTGKQREDIVSVTPMMAGYEAPPQITPSLILSYDKFNAAVFETLPNFLKDDMKGTPEYKALFNGQPVSGAAVVQQAAQAAAASAIYQQPQAGVVGSPQQSAPVAGFAPISGDLDAPPF